MFTCGVRSEKKCACMRTERFYLYTLRRVHGSCYCLDAILPERTKNLRSAQDYEWKTDSRELDDTWDLFALTSPYKSPCKNLSVTLALSLLSLIPPFFVFPPLRVPLLPLMVPRWRTLPRWALSMLRMKMTRNTSSSWNSTILNVLGLLDPSCFFAMSASALEYQVLLCLVPVECYQEHVVDTVVLLVYWNQRFSCTMCLHIVVAACEVLHDWCQSGICSRDTWGTLQSNRAPVEKLGSRSFRSVIGPEKNWICCCFSLLPFVHAWLWNDLYVNFSPSWQDCCGTKTRSFWRCKCCSDSVHRTLIGSKPDAALKHVQSLWYVLQAGRTLISLSQLDQLHVAHLVDSATWFFTEDHLTFPQIVTYGFCTWSHLEFFQLFVDFIHLRFIL